MMVLSTVVFSMTKGLRDMGIHMHTIFNIYLHCYLIIFCV